MDTNENTPDGARAPSEGDRIAKVLSRAGVASRRDAERLILEGRVKVNGETVTSPAINVTDKDRLSVDDEVVGAPEATRLWLYHKPAGLVTTEHDEEGRPTVFDSLPEDMPRVMSVGRLDLTSEGLLVLTNDGEIKRRLELPSTGWSRRYRVRIHGTPSDSDLEPLRRGITVDDMEYQPMEVTIDRQQGANAWLSVTLREGKNREIRRAMEQLGFTVNRLIRVSYGPFQLGDLPVGDVEEVRPKIVRDQLGLAKPKPEPMRTRTKRPDSDPTPAVDEKAEDRPEREVLATARPEGARAKRELKARGPKARSERDQDSPSPRGSRRPGSTNAFGKSRTYMRVDEDRAARAAEDAAAAERPRRDDGERPRSAGFRSHRPPEGGDRGPTRSTGFRSHRAEEGGDRPVRAVRDRPDQAGRRRDEDRPRRSREDGGERPARAYKPRQDEERPARPYKPRTEGDRPSRPYQSRDRGDRPARPYKARDGSSDRPQRDVKPSRPARSGVDADRPTRPYKPRVPREGDPERPARGFRAGGDAADRPARPYKPRVPRGASRDGDAPRSPRSERAPRPAGPSGARKGPPRSGGSAGPRGPKPRKG
jgi:23S rRNA pseudouridine2605 synthase